jgi:uncharacterized protein YdiU (UPF0061 family)
MINFDNTYARLPDRFYAHVVPAKVPAPSLVRLNEALAEELGLDPVWLTSAEGLAMLSGNQPPKEADPIAQAYAGHQFGGWVPVLGDGRAILLGEVIDLQGKRRDLQLKGSGQTPFSRRGDGKATLGSAIREYLCSEAMAALNVPTTRALALVATGEIVPREHAHPGAILTRIAGSHIRVGTFQYFQGQQDQDALRQLADHAMKRHFPEATQAQNPYLAFFERVIAAQASLIAKWMQLGFIHGVMNTDNMTISGETIDFGPCAFIDSFHPDKVFSSIDRHGRYAWSNQPQAAHWNLARLGDALSPLIAKDPAAGKTLISAALDRFPDAFKEAYLSGFAAKFGILSIAEKEEQFIADSLQFMAEQEVDFTLFFRELTRIAGGSEPARLRELLGSRAGVEEWIADWKVFTGGEDDERVRVMQDCNPVLIPRNHRVEQAIQAAEAGEFGIFRRLADAWAEPFAEHEEMSDLEEPPLSHEIVCETFCGT